jgi:hypothetical protein
MTTARNTPEQGAINPHELGLPGIPTPHEEFLKRDRGLISAAFDLSHALAEINKDKQGNPVYLQDPELHIIEHALTEVDYALVSPNIGKVVVSFTSRNGNTGVKLDRLTPYYELRDTWSPDDDQAFSRTYDGQSGSVHYVYDGARNILTPRTEDWSEFSEFMAKLVGITLAQEHAKNGYSPDKLSRLIKPYEVLFGRRFTISTSRTIVVG